MKNMIKNFLIILITISTFVFVSYSMVPDLTKKDYINSQDNTIVSANEIEKKEITSKSAAPKMKYIKTPDQVKAIYMTACVASTKNFKDSVIKIIDDTEINSIIIDVKDFSGTISFPSDNPKLLGVNGSGCRVSGMAELLQELKAKNIYTIARITVFQDSYYTKIRPDLAVQKKSDGGTWKDYKGISFIDVGAKEYWEYIIELSKETYTLGFDEINFDYVRFPSDGNLNDMKFPFSQKIIDENPTRGLDTGKAIMVENFFKYLKKELKDTGMIISDDLFGMVTTNYDDLGIGQVLERALPYFDYIAPMVYPSHYDSGFNGWKNPNLVPYELILYVMSEGVKRVESFLANSEIDNDLKKGVHVKQLRPWIQDFDYGGDYGPKEVRAQIQGVYDSGLDSWMIWDPSNRYTKEALEIN
jgi:hypothetical protein